MYFGEHGGEKTHDEIQQTHLSYLNSVKETEEEAIDSLIYSYKHSINGFAALLTQEEASKLSGMQNYYMGFACNPLFLSCFLAISRIYGVEIIWFAELEEVVSVYETKPGKYSKQTTRSWEFVGLEEGDQKQFSKHHTVGQRELPLRAGFGKNVIVGVLDSGKNSSPLL